MAHELRIDVVVSTTAAPAAVWTLLADVGTWKDWGRWSMAEIERPGTPDPAGVGAVRRFKYRGRVTREEVVGFEPPSRFAYELRSGLPLRNYHAEVTVVPSGEGSRLEWHSRFDPTLAGRLWRPGLARFVRDVAARLARAAETS
jgi:hypothetical protein